jgi:hypothetical protein
MAPHFSFLWPYFPKDGVHLLRAERGTPLACVERALPSASLRAGLPAGVGSCKQAGNSSFGFAQDRSAPHKPSICRARIGGKLLASPTVLLNRRPLVPR